MNFSIASDEALAGLFESPPKPLNNGAVERLWRVPHRPMAAIRDIHSV